MVASQLLGADVPASLHKLAEHASDAISRPSFQLILAFVKQDEIRPAMGSAGSVAFFMDYLKKKDSEAEAEPDNETFSVVNALCLCCREAVNRVRIREQKGLHLLLEILQQDQFSKIHDRIISALVCYLYDDASFNVLLDNGVVPILLHHLKTHAGLETSEPDIMETPRKSTGGKCKPAVVVPDVNDDDPVANQQDTPSVNITIQPATPIKGRPISKRLEAARMRFRTQGLRLCASAPGALNLMGEPNSEASETQTLGEACDSGAASSTLNPSKSVSTLSNMVKDVESPKCSDGTPNMKSKPTYSMDSPTYQQVLEWKMDDYYNASGMKRDPVSFTDGSEGGSSPRNFDVTFSPSHSGPYSPMSVASYMSSECCSLEYSPPSSPLSTGVGMSPPSSPFSAAQSANMSPEWSPVQCHSPASPRSPWWYKGEGQDDYLLYSSEEEDEDHHNQPTCKEESDAQKPEEPGLQNESISETFLDILNEDPVYCEAIHGSDFGKALMGASLTRQLSVASQLGEESPSTQPKAKKFKAAPSTKRRLLSPDTRRKIQEAVEKNLQSSESRDGLEKVFSAKSDLQIQDVGNKESKLKDSKKITEHNILVLLSRVSYLENPSKYLVNTSCLTTLCMYIKQVKDPLPRCGRLLQRLTRNFLCFESLILGMAPSVFDIVLQMTNNQDDCKTDDIPSNNKTIPTSPAPSSSKTTDKTGEKSDPESSKGQSESINQAKDECGRGVKRKRELSSESRSASNPNILLEIDKTTMLEDLRRQLLNNLACVAESRFGKGTILSILQKGTHVQREQCAVCLPYLCRYANVFNLIFC